MKAPLFTLWLAKDHVESFVYPSRPSLFYLIRDPYENLYTKVAWRFSNSCA